jgi:2-polyprenyl-3-methyl-5-hydroxy-6-metoxy-1,4-benzoquinol methylase
MPGTNTPRVDQPRFPFGKNWTRFLSVLDEKRITDAEQSVLDMLEVDDLRQRSFLDAGSGSGLFSLVANRLGATRVRSFDYDANSVACTRELKRRYAPTDASWTIEQGSVLDTDYLRTLGSFDIVYSWGVLHHTGDMWRALANVLPLVNSGGRLFISIYNDQGWKSTFWRQVKVLFNRSRIIRGALLLAAGTYFGGRRFFKTMPPGRGMSYWHDLVDWLGGYPFEVARPDEVVAFCRTRGFRLERLEAVGAGHGTNQFVFFKKTVISH